MILIPARNEGPRIGRIVRDCQMVCPDVQIVVVVNGCSDDTAAQATAAGAEVIHSPPGYGEALLAGYRHASVQPALPWLLQLDADGQHPIAAIPALLDSLDDADLSIGSRLVSGGAAPGWPRHRRWTIAMMGAVTSVLSGLRVRDVSSGFQAMRPAVVHALAADFPIELTDANVLVRLFRKGFQIVEVPVRMAEREGGTSMHGGWKSLIYAGRTLAAVRAEMRG
jgi:glycosyltransferase involved in cell wall biosynthesis